MFQLLSEFFSNLDISSIFDIILFLTCIIALPFFLYKYVKNKKKHKYIERHGVSLTGVVTKRQKGIMSYLLTYTYEYQGARYTQAQRVIPEVFDTRSEGSSVTVYALPENPQRATLAQTQLYYLEYRFVFTLSICLLIITVLSIFLIILSILLIHLIR